jgi:hypothetical protein
LICTALQHITNTDSVDAATSLTINQCGVAAASRVSWICMALQQGIVIDKIDVAASVTAVYCVVWMQPDYCCTRTTKDVGSCPAFLPCVQTAGNATKDQTCRRNTCKSRDCCAPREGRA